MGIFGLDMSASSYFTQIVYVGTIGAACVGLFGFLIKMLFTKRKSTYEEMRD